MSGGGSSTPAQSNVTTTSIPEYARPYVERSLGQAAALTDINQNPYTPYGGQQVAAFTPLQSQAMGNIANQQSASQLTDASNIASQVGQMALQTPEQARGLQNTSLGYGAQAAGAGDRYSQMATSPGAIGAYMSPYMQNVVDLQKQEANRAYDISGSKVMGQGAAAGAFGGTRDALMRAENERNRNTALAGIQAQGSQSAYDQAMKSMQYGSGLGLQGLQTGLQGVQGAVGAGQYGLAGLGTAGTAASTLGSLGQTQFGQDMAINQAQMQAGALQQAQEQRGLDIAYQQYQDSQNYPYKQLGFMSDIYRGLPMSQSAQSMYQNPSAISQAAGIGTAGMGMYGMYKMANAEGGQIKEKRMADGGITQLFDVGGSIKADLSRMSPEELQEYIGKSSSPSAKKMAQEILAEKAFMAKQQQSAGVAQLPSNLPVGEAMADGGIIAFADRGEVRDTDPGAQGVQAVSDAVFERLAAEREASNTGDLGIAPLVAPAAAPVAAPTGISAPVVNPASSTYGGIPTMSPESKEAFSQYAKLYKDLRSDTPKAREEAKYMALMQAGFGIAGGTSPNAFANINQGVQPALAQYQSALKDIRKEDREALKGLVDLGLKKEEFIQRAEKMGIDKYTADKVFEAHKYSADATVRAAGIRAAAEKQPRSTTEGDITQSQIQNGILIDRLTEIAKTRPLTNDEQAALNTARSSNRTYMEILSQKRPVQPNAVLPNAVTARLEKDSQYNDLEVALVRARNDPARQEEIRKKMDERVAYIKKQVAEEASPGRGIGGTGGSTNDPFGLFNN